MLMHHGLCLLIWPLSFHYRAGRMTQRTGVFVFASILLVTGGLPVIATKAVESWRFCSYSGLDRKSGTCRICSFGVLRVARLSW